MKSVVFYKPHDARVEEKPKPLAKYGEAFVEINICRVSATGKHIFEGGYPACFRIVSDHEFSGVIVDLGPGVTKFKNGDRVTIDPNLPFGQCFFCRSGKPNCGRENLSIDHCVDGAYAPLIAVPVTQTYLVPDNLSLEYGAMTELVACAANGANSAQIQPGADVAALDAGPIGLITIY
jgi:threonine dehydrogenase-like Zn-dependent dehydrogenase